VADRFTKNLSVLLSNPAGYYSEHFKPPLSDIVTTFATDDLEVVNHQSDETISTKPVTMS